MTESTDFSPSEESPTWKFCPKCGESKPLNEFHNDRHSSDGKTSRCKLCNNAATKEYRNSSEGVRARNLEHNQEYRRDHPERYLGYEQNRWDRNADWMQDKRLRDHYNHTLEDYYTFLDEQTGCGICHTLTPGGRGEVWFEIDHDHDCMNGCTGKLSCGKCVRGVVCHRCNSVVIPIFEGRRTGDISDLCEAVEDYMNRYLIRRAVIEALEVVGVVE